MDDGTGTDTLPLMGYVGTSFTVPCVCTAMHDVAGCDGRASFELGESTRLYDVEDAYVHTKLRFGCFALSWSFCSHH